MTNREVRAWYHLQIQRITPADADLAATGTSLEQRARHAFASRREARLKARTLMSDAADVHLLEARDLALYGRPDGPTFESLFQSLHTSALPTDDIYRMIIESASRTNSEFDRRFGAS